MAGALDDKSEEIADDAEWFGEVFVVGGSPGDRVAIEHCSDSDIDAEDGFAPPPSACKDIESVCLVEDGLLTAMQFG